MNLIYIGKNTFIRIHYFFRIHADFEGNKTTNIYKQNPVCNSYYIVSDLKDVTQSGYYESPLGYDTVE